jgi:HAD superfamily hydrolase (TIGR01490 family)
MIRGIAFFDFDGTITTKDTLLEFIRFYKGDYKFYLGFILKSPYIVGYKLGLLKNSVAKQKVLQFFFRGESLEIFNDQCRKFSQKVLPGLIRSKAVAEIEKHKAANIQVVIVSASAENWIQNWCNDNQLKYIGTKLVTKDGKITGNFDGNNCHGIEKVTRIKEHFHLSDFDQIYCYGDSNGDKQMLELGTHSFYKPFR